MMSPWSIDLYLKASRFACERHSGQKFKGTELPYFLHLSQVVGEVVHCLSAEDYLDGDSAIAMAWLHDTIEDTAVEREDLVHAGFTEKVADGVVALTKNAKLPKDERMQDSIDRIIAHSAEAALVKLADRITNLQPPPQDWSPAKVGQYAEEAEMILEKLGYASRQMGARFRQRLAQYRAAEWLH
jgi:(p)ppGpp synthase/HD superfamily hydrolase